MDLLITGNGTGAVVSAVFWLVAGYLSVSRLNRQPLAHRATVFLVVASFLVFDAFTLGLLTHVLDRAAASALYSFLNGFQITAAIAAVIFVRRIRR